MKAREDKVNGALTAVKTRYSMEFAVDAVQNTNKSLGKHFNMKLPHFKIKEAFDEARENFSYGSNSDKIASTAKLLGKLVANIGIFTVEAGYEALKPENIGRLAKQHLNENSHSMSDEQIKCAHELIEKGNKAREHRLESERNEE
jgi:hypothetical protein